ncbi:uncharacterized protein F4822DRAFT_428544 [Hypoxylon trugodes]|uniref:uncharacterized protein n=1 Tax=Hypoxylon trugodes TaxID=326681 RepID=UPI00219297AD|nr:uncharacterized protein F4822DRAFT_428544 [Hypoxylon trugodes]KAI1390202.1 hypothetical protein F4822DRAFT_428544 [Hypoxylon trugodes]
MTASHNFMGHDNDKNQLEMEWKAGKRQQFPPPEALPAYVNRALPPRPNDSNSPSSSDSPEKNTQPQTASNPELLVSQHEDGRQNPDTTGMLNDAGLAMVQPLQLTTSSVPQFRQKQQRPPTIASPQPRYPAFMVLEVDERDEDIVSPVSAPLSGNNTHQQHEVSPISPVESERSIHSKVSDLDNASSESPDSPSIKDGSNSSRSGSRENQTEQSPSDQAITPLWYLEHQIQQINLRYSDPGSPISGAVVHPPSSFPSDPNLRRLRDSVASHSRSHSNSGSSTYSVYSPTSPKNNISLPLPLHNQFLYQPHSALRTPPQLPPPSRAASGRKRDSGVKLASPVTGSGASPPKVAFAGAGAGIGAKTDGFSVTRARANSSKRTAPPPPPLKLSERPLVDKYVKTPFPGLEEERRVKAEIERKGVEGGKGVGGEKERERERQRTPLHRKSASEGDGLGQPAFEYSDPSSYDRDQTSSSLFDKGESVLCYYGHILFEAIILDDVAIQRTGKVEYLIKAEVPPSFEEWVPRGFILKLTDQNKQSPGRCATCNQSHFDAMIICRNINSPPTANLTTLFLPSDSGYATASCRSNAALNHQLGLPNQKLINQPQGSPLEFIQHDDDDVQTVYTEISNISEVKRGSYITTLADDLFNEIGAKEMDEETIEKLSSTLPTLLKALALNFGYRASSSQMHHDVMVFVYKYRDSIAASFKNNCYQTNKSDQELPFMQGACSTEIMDRWLASNDETDLEEMREDILPDDDPTDEEPPNVPPLEEYRRLINNDPGYNWLLERMRRETALSRAKPYALNNIREAIMIAIPQGSRVSRKVSPESTKATYFVDWDILVFLNDQEYDMPNAEAVANAITLTGSYTDAQALSCRQYMTQIWPSTAPQTLQLLQEMLRCPEYKSMLSFNRPSKITLEAFIGVESVIVTAIGIPEFVVEIGEQLAWLGAALRSSPLNHRAILCTPYVAQAVHLRNEISELECSILFNTENPQANPQNENGQCWHHLFANPVIAQSFPILERREIDTGLEAPLDMLVSLARARYVDMFKSKVFVKGFSTMLVPTKQSENLLVWHLLYNENPNERISYLDCGLEHADVKIASFEQSRHILGWCSNARSIVGTTRAVYNIGRSRLPSAHSCCVLEKAEILGGLGYLTKLQWISSKYFVFWDEEEKRGWLVNGASALLHVLRASLEYSKRKFQSRWLLGPGALNDTVDSFRSTSALEVLISEANRDLKLYVDKTEVYNEETTDKQKNTTVIKRQTRHYRLEDRIEHIYNILEKLIDQQTDAERRSGLQIKFRPRRQLEGWDFRDLATDGDPFFPRVAHLQTIAKGWVDFTRAIHAVTLFGRGFGELIQPQYDTAISCPRWSILPSGNYYLAACVSDLHEVMENLGDPNSNPRRLCDNIIWHTKQAAFNPCSCTKDNASKHHDPVQALFPIRFMRNLKKKTQIKLDSEGAAIFGHNMSLHWHWTDSGDPIKGDPPQEVTDTTYDSGLGTSIDSSDGRSVPGSVPNSDSPAPSDTLPRSQSESPQSNLQGVDLRSRKHRLQDTMSSISKRANF